MSSSPTYEAAIVSLSALIPELFVSPAAAGLPSVRRKFSLDQIRILCSALGNPQDRFPSVLIAGTNGKGSTAATLASIARAAGLRAGLYTSPHLERVNERIRLLSPTPKAPGAPSMPQLHRGMGGITDAGTPHPGSLRTTFDSRGGVLAADTGESQIPDEAFARLYFHVHDTAQQLVLSGRLPSLPSYFELLTALAFLYFAEPYPGSPPVDLAVLEVGMGGRLDATNLVDPILSVITDISLDHQEWLGSTIALIAREKAGILRPSGTLITLPQHPEANQAIGEAATERNVRAINATQYMPQRYAAQHPGSSSYSIEVELNGDRQTISVDSPLRGVHQHRNIALAIAAAIDLANAHHFPITAAAIEQGIRTTHWPGRLERLSLPLTLPVSSFVTGHDFSRADQVIERDRALAPEGSSTPKDTDNSPVEVILDVAHNPAGAWALRAALSSLPQLSEGSMGSGKAQTPGRPVLGAHGLASETGEAAAVGKQVLIFACLRDKPLREMTQILFPLFDHVILAPIHSPRATDMDDLIAAAAATGIPGTPAATVEEALDLALKLHPASIVVSGSVYLVGEARHLLIAKSSSRPIDSTEGERPGRLVPQP